MADVNSFMKADKKVSTRTGMMVGRIVGRVKKLRPFISVSALLAVILAIGIVTMKPTVMFEPAPIDERAEDMYSELLGRFVNREGLVKYDSLRQDPGLLKPFIDFIAAVSPRNHPERFPSADHQKAYWINAYNALTMWRVISQGVLTSVRGRDFGLNFFVLSKHTVGGERLSLYSIENRILRRKFDDPRVHFAISCASGSCPPLASRVYDGEQLEKQLEAAAARFIHDTSNVYIDPVRQTVVLNRIFKWYARDFGNSTGNVLRFLASYHPTLETELERQGSDHWKLRYQKYDWQLNEL